MPITGQNTKINEEGQEKEAFVVSFTNGALEQIKGFCSYYNQKDLTEVVKLAVSFLQQIREMNEKEEKHKVQ